MSHAKRTIARILLVAVALIPGLMLGGCAWFGPSDVASDGPSAAEAPLQSVEGDRSVPPAEREAPTAPLGALAPEYQPVVDYVYGGDDDAVRALGNRIATAPRTERAAIEANLLAVLVHEDLTPAGRDFAVRMLRLVASDRSVPYLEQLLRLPETTDLACYALESIPSANVDNVLIRASGALSGRAQIAVIGSLAARRTQAAVETLGRHAMSTDLDVAEAAIHALGRIGGREAARTLITSDIPPDLLAVREDAVLMTGDVLLASGDVPAAVDVYQLMLQSDWPFTIVAAARGLARSRGEVALPTILELVHFPWYEVRQSVPDILNDIPGPAVARQASLQLPGMAPDMQVLMLVALVERGDQAAVPGIEALLGVDDEAVEMMALTALSQLGDASSVPVIADAMSRGGMTRLAALAALEQIAGGVQVDLALRQALLEAPDADVVDLVEALARRGCRLVIPILFEMADEEHIAIRRAAISALGVLAGPENAAAMVDMLVAVDAEERELAEGAVMALARRLPDGRLLSEAIQRVLPTAPAPVRASLIRALGTTGHPDALATLRRSLDDSQPEAREAAARALIEWPGVGALQDALNLAESSTSMTLRVLAVRGGLRMLEGADAMPAGEKLTWSRSFYAAAPRPEEKALVVSGVARIETSEAMDFLLDLLDDPAVGPQALAALQRVHDVLGGEDDGAQTRELRDAERLERVRAALEQRLGAETELDRAGWTATASHRSEQAPMALDGDMATRWDTGTHMRPDMWFQLDLGASARLSRLVLDTTPSGNDYPREYAIYVTSDLEDWGAPVATGQGTGAVLDIALAPKAGRHLRIVQQGASDANHWSIHALRLFAMR